MARFLARFCLALLTIFPSAAWASDGAAGAHVEARGVPPGFGELARDRELLVDLYFGGAKIGEARVIARPGSVQFKEPAQLLSLIPNVEPSAALAAALAAELPANANLLCSDPPAAHCGALSPQVAGIIFDEDHFRVDLFVNPALLGLIKPDGDPYLPAPTAPLAVTSALGLALSGSNHNAPVYNLQNRTIAGLRNGRIRIDSSYASRQGFVVDSMVGEIDRPGLRYSAGLFWAPGVDLTGQRRILGIGVGTQFDTRADRDSLRGTPLVLFLGQASQVDVLIDGRLVSSRSYEAGNNVLDTTTLPQGSYPLLLRIHEANGNVREERRFFTKNVQIAPVGQPLYFGYAGVLANTRRGRPLSLSNDVFYQFGTARRLNERLALDLSVIGTAAKPMVEAGAWLITPLGQARVAALASSRGDRGAVVQITSSQSLPLSVAVDLRRVWSHDGRPLLPLPTYVDTFNGTPDDSSRTGEGSYTQASGSVGYRFGTAYISVIGSLRKDEGLPSDYSIGPNINWPVLNRGGLQIALQTDAQLTRTTTAAYLGFRMQLASGRYGLTGNFGRRQLSRDAGPDASRIVGDSTAHWSYSRADGTDATLAAGVTREMESTAAHAEATLTSPYGSARGQFLHDFEGGGRTQYGLSVQTGALLGRGAALVGGRNLTDSALVVVLDGKGKAQFEVLVDGQPRGRIVAGQRLPIFLQPYRAYSVKLRPVNAAAAAYDAAAREVSLYPGNVQQLRWHVEPLLTIFGRAVRPDGSPVADALVTSGKGIGQSDSQGYFQIESAPDDMLSFAVGEGAPCKASVVDLGAGSDFVPVGRIVCK